MEKQLQKIYLTFYNLLIADIMIKNVRLVELNIIAATVFEYSNFKGDLIECKCLCCNKNYQHKFDKKLKKRFFNTYKLCNHDNNKLILLLRKNVYPYEYMDD